MDRAELIDKLDRAIDKAATFAIQRGYPIYDKKVGTWVGNTIIKKNKNGFYDILSLNRDTTLYENICVFDVAIIIAQRHTAGEFGVVKKVLVLENKFSKYHTDMLHYLHCMKGAKKRKEYDVMSILEDKFQVSEIRAKNTRDNISIFKRVR